MATLLCNTCSKSIASEYVNLGEERNYHPECFNCSTCGQSLAGNPYFEMDNELYCENDYHKKFSPTCGGCDNFIKDEYVEVMGLTYHKNCFVCKGCQKPFGDMQYFKYDGESYCADCHKSRSSVCHKCSKPITDKTYSAMGKTFHLDCFTCPVCNKGFDGGAFVPFNDLPYHQDCYRSKHGKKCGHCSNNITGEYYSIDGKDLHKECLDAYKEHKKSNPVVDAIKSVGQAVKDLVITEKPEKQPTTTVPPVTTTTTTTTTTTNPVPEKPQVQVQPAPKVEEKKEDPSPILRTADVPAQKLEEGVKTGQKEGSASGTSYAYELLVKPPFPKGVDPTKREKYLTYAEFERLFKTTYDEFQLLPKWKQNDAKKKLKLF